MWRLGALFFASLVLMLPAHNPLWAQQPSLPAVNLGDTGIRTGEEVVLAAQGHGAQSAFDNRTADNTGHVLPESTNANTLATHLT